jgi:hypothetical protein
VVYRFLNICDRIVLHNIERKIDIYFSDKLELFKFCQILFGLFD